MSDKIGPALTAGEWAERRVQFIGIPELVFRDDGDGMEVVLKVRGGLSVEKYKFDISPGIDLPAIIALANSALPDDDPRKITREHVRACRRELNDWLEGRDEILKRLAAALESYLPPEEPPAR